MADSPKPGDLDRLVALQQLILELRSVERLIYIPQTDKKENDVEHSYSLAMFAWYLAARFDPGLSQEKILKYSLIHDLVEAYAGDVSAFAPDEDRKVKVEREAESLKRIEAEFADFPDMLSAIHAYEARMDDESKFVHALDKIITIIINYIDGGRIWKDHNITLEQMITNKKITTKESTLVGEFLELLINLLQKEQGRLFN